MVEIEFFTKKDCPRCPLAKNVLKKVLKERGLKFEEVVKERDVEKDADAFVELLMLGSASTPTLKVGSTVLVGNDAIDEEKIKGALGE